MAWPSTFPVLALAAFTASGQVPIRDPVDDAALLEAEAFDGVRGDPGHGSAPAFRRYAASLFFPAGAVGGRAAFGGLEAEALDRGFGGAAEGASPVQRYALTGGLETVKAPRHRGFALATLSYQGDFRRVDWDGVGSEWIYAHLFTARPGLEWGLGIDLMRFYDEWTPYPLVFLEWWMLDRTKVRANGDILELRQFLGTALCATAGVRYNLWFGSVGPGSTFRLETLGLEAGLEYRVAGDVSLRLKAKRFFWGVDALHGREGRGGVSGGTEGGSLRLALAWAP